MARKSRAEKPKRSSPPRRSSESPAALLENIPEEVVEIASLRPHPENYKVHPDEQLDHIAASLKQFGVYRNVVVASDGTLLAGHGVVEAASKKTTLKRIAVKRMPFGPGDPRALKILALDNELPKFGEVDDRRLSEILKRIRDESETGLLGTGYDDQRLAALLMVTRPASEIADMNEAAEYVGMPEYDEGGEPIRLVITFVDEASRKRFIDAAKMKIVKQVGATWSARWPTVENEDVHALRFVAEG